MSLEHATLGDNPTVVLVGGRMILEDGEVLDSRQPVERDRRSSFAQRTLASSRLWWMTTTQLVEAILDDAGPDSYALVLGPRVLAEPGQDGTLRKVQLRSIFKGRVSKLEIGQTKSDRKRKGGLEPLHETPWDETVRFGVNLGDPATRWRLLERGNYLLPYVSSAIRPAVIVDVDSVPVRMSYREYEASHLRSNTTLVLPHSEASERHVKEVLNWQQSGRVTQANEWGPKKPPTDAWQQREESRLPIHEAGVVVSADFRITGLYREGEWRDPSGLDAARVYVQQHADLRIGIWDLLESQSLRETLLQPAAVTPVPSEPASIPASSNQRADAHEEQRENEWEQHEAFLVSIKDRMRGLRPLGWEEIERAEPSFVAFAIGSSADFQLPLTEPLEVEGKKTSLAWLALTLNKRPTRVTLEVAIWAHFNPVRLYLEARSAQLAEIANPGKWDFASPIVPILWEEKGGWGDNIDWARRVADLGARTRSWREVLADLRPRLITELTQQTFS